MPSFPRYPTLLSDFTICWSNGLCTGWGLLPILGQLSAILGHFRAHKRRRVDPREKAPRSLKVRARSVDNFQMSITQILLSIQPRSLPNTVAVNFESQNFHSNLAQKFKKNWKKIEKTRSEHAFAIADHLSRRLRSRWPLRRLFFLALGQILAYMLQIFKKEWKVKIFFC